MNLSIIIAIALFFAAVILSQKINIGARDRLDDDMKLKIANTFVKRNLNYSILVLVMIFAYMLGIYAFPQYSNGILITYAFVFVLYIASKMILNVRTLKEIGAPDGYIRSVYISFGLFIGGAVAAGL